MSAMRSEEDLQSENRSLLKKQEDLEKEKSNLQNMLQELKLQAKERKASMEEELEKHQKLINLLTVELAEEKKAKLDFEIELHESRMAQRNQAYKYGNYPTRKRHQGLNPNIRVKTWGNTNR